MKSLLYIFSGLTALCGLGGCGSLVQDVSVNTIPSARNQMVVQSFISPQDTVLAVYVDRPTSILGLYTNPIWSNGLRLAIDNATVDVSDGARTVRLQKRNATNLAEIYYGISTRNFQVVPGRTYTLTVSAPNFPAISAQCTVPVAVTPSRVQIDSTLEGSFGAGSSMRYVGRLVWRDPAGGANYYKVAGATTAGIIRTIFQGQTSRDTLFVDTYPMNASSEATNFVTDKNREGQEIASGRLESINFYTGPNASGRVVDVQLSMSLSSYDPNLYRFQEAVVQQRNQDENPFAEPILIPSNIQGGLGCFGAYNQSSLTVRVK